MNEFHGFIFSKLHLIGSKSEGPSYFLQQFDYSEIPLEKQAQLWSEDPALQEVLGTKVTVHGAIQGGRLCYENIMPYVYQPDEGHEEHCLTVDLSLETEEIWLDKMPPTPPPRPFDMTLDVEWPYRSIWKGICPTSQIYDFFVEFEGQCIWQWSKGKTFLQALTPVSIPGGSPISFTETWIICPEDLQSEGIYTVRGLFIASGQEIKKQIRIKFAH
ncbi:MAG: hypothetical protein D3908_11990 [Candidatus Electrothrix sp. AUS4]|nr:hypothetical protein [Candidatus Electrothrix sp. AUS4]